MPKHRAVSFAAAIALSLLWPAGSGAAPAPAPSGPDFATVYRKVKPSVVYIVVATATGAQSGSGFVYDSDATHTIVATADHVVQGARRIDVIFDSNVKQRYSASLKEHDRHSDVAFLEVAVGGRAPLALMERPQIAEGSAIAAIGYPRAAKAFEAVTGDDLRPSVHAGIISAIRLNGTIVQIDAQVDHGDSGGPVIDAKSGKVIGIVDASLLDPDFAARGLEKPLPGSAYAVSAPTLYAVRNGLVSAPAEVASRLSARSETTASAPQAGRAQTSSAYRVAFVTAHLSNSTSQAIEQRLTQRIREHFTGGNTFYAIPAAGLSYTETSKVQSFCDEHRVNAIVIPYFAFAADAAQAGNAAVRGTLIVADCAGVPYYIGSKLKRESRLFANRSQVREVLDMGNDVADQMLADFEQYRERNAAAWTNLLKTGVPLDPLAKLPPVAVGVLFEDHKFRVAFLREDGRGARAGFQAGDVIEAIDGAPIPSNFNTFEVSRMLEGAAKVLVRRPEGEKTITLTP